MKPLQVGSIIFTTTLYPALLLICIVAVAQGGNTFASTLFLSLCMLIPLFLGLWAIISLHLRVLWFLGLLATLLFLHAWWSTGIVIAACLLSYILFDWQMTKESISIISPSSNWLYVWHGGNTSLVNHHWKHPVQRYALDLVRLDVYGKRARGISPQALTAYYCFGTPLLSPLAGTIVHIENDYPDLEVGIMDKDHPFGNCIVIQPTDQPQRRIVLAHLMQCSIISQPGAVVQPGEIIGCIGNSGNTSEPHLHVHAQKLENGKWIGIPLRINGHRVMRNSVICPSPQLEMSPNRRMLSDVNCS